MKAIRALIWRIRWLRAWHAVVTRHQGDNRARREAAMRFNSRKFWFQRALTIPKEKP